MSGGRRSNNPILVPPGNFTSPGGNTTTNNASPSGAPASVPVTAGGGGMASASQGGSSTNTVGNSTPVSQTVSTGGGGILGTNPTPTTVTTTAPSVQLVTTRNAKILTAKMMNHNDIMEVYNSFRSLQFSDSKLDFVKFVDSLIHELMDFEFNHLPKGTWRSLSSEDFFEFLLNEYQPDSRSAESSLEDRFRAIDSKLFELDYRNPKCFNGLFLEVTRTLNMSSATLTVGRIGALSAILTDRIPRVPYASKKLYLHMKAEDFKPARIDDWFARARDELKILHQAVVKVESYGVQVGTKPAHIMSQPRIPKREPREEVRPKREAGDRKEKRKSFEDSKDCKVCCRSNYAAATCQFNIPGHKHPDANLTDENWSESPYGKAWEAKGRKTLPFNQTLSGAAWQAPSKSSGDKKKFEKEQKKCKENLSSLSLHHQKQETIHGNIQKLSDSNVSILLDTGALHGNYISNDISAKIFKTCKENCRSVKRNIQGAMKGAQTCANLECSLCVDVINESNKKQSICFNAANIDTHHEIIIGRETIKDNNLCHTFPSHFMHVATPPTHYDGTYLNRSAAGGTLCNRPRKPLHGKVEKDKGEPGRDVKEDETKGQMKPQEKNGHELPEILGSDDPCELSKNVFKSIREELNVISLKELHSIITTKLKLTQTREKKCVGRVLWEKSSTHACEISK